MANVKMFYGCGGIDSIETKIENWLDRNPSIKILQVAQSQSGEVDFNIVVSVYYTYN